MASIRQLPVLLLLFPILISSPVFGAQRFVLRIERSNQGAKLQNGLVLAAGQVTLTRNTNDWCGPEDEARLGEMLRPENENDRADEAYLDQIQVRSQRIKKNMDSLPKVEAPNPSSFPPEVSNTQYYLGRDRLSGNSSGILLVQTAVKRNCSSKIKWKFVNGVIAKLVRVQEKDYLQTTYLPTKKVAIQPLQDTDCRVIGTMKAPSKKSVYRCNIDKFGIALLIGPES